MGRRDVVLYRTLGDLRGDGVVEVDAMEIVRGNQRKEDSQSGSSEDTLESEGIFVIPCICVDEEAIVSIIVPDIIISDGMNCSGSEEDRKFNVPIAGV